DKSEQHLGAVYRTDALISDKVEVAAVAPDDSHAPVIYPVAVMKDSSYSEEAKALVNFLAGDKAGEIFEKYGFKVLK
ncbi:MAG: extracellular solute-binding protein, partial [Dethiobacteria bacterium]